MSRALGFLNRGIGLRAPYTPWERPKPDSHDFQGVPASDNGGTAAGAITRGAPRIGYWARRRLPLSRRGNRHVRQRGKKNLPSEDSRLPGIPLRKERRRGTPGSFLRRRAQTPEYFRTAPATRAETPRAQTSEYVRAAPRPSRSTLVLTCFPSR